MNKENCWNCGKPSKESIFCQFCSTLDPPTPDYYRFLGLERKLSVDAGQLQRLFYELSRKLHPDMLEKSSAEERKMSLEAAAILNDAYRTLKNPVSRAEYVLREQDVELADDDKASKRPPPELLEEVFDLNMALEELRGGDVSVRPQLEDARSKFSAVRGEIDLELEQLFQDYDNFRQREVLARIREVLIRRRYVCNLLSEIESELVA